MRTIRVRLFTRARNGRRKAAAMVGGGVAVLAGSILVIRLAWAGGEVQPSSAKAKAPAGSPDSAVVRLADLLRPTREQRQKLWTAEQIVVASCMKARGFQYASPPFDDGDDLLRKPSGATPADVLEAARRGYGLAERFAHEETASRRSKQPGADALPTRPDQRRAFIDALIGPDTVADPFAYRDSCYERARDEIHGHDPNNERGSMLAALEEKVEARVAADAQHQSAVRDWRACMQASGYAYPTPHAAAEALAQAYARGRLTWKQLHAKELQIAPVEASCSAAVELVERERAARSRAEEAVAADQQATLRALREEQQLALAAAERILRQDSLLAGQRTPVIDSVRGCAFLKRFRARSSCDKR